MWHYRVYRNIISRTLVFLLGSMASRVPSEPPYLIMRRQVYAFAIDGHRIVPPGIAHLFTGCGSDVY
jgi:hypothetical protein